MGRGLTIDVAVDDLDDPRFVACADTAGYSVFEAWGRFLRLWAHCLKRQAFVVHDAVIRQYLGPNGVDAILQGGVEELALGTREEGGIYVRGTRERLSWLGRVREGASAGGRARSDAARNDAGKFVSDAANTPAHRHPLTSLAPSLDQPVLQPTPAPSPSLSSSRSRSQDQGPPAGSSLRSDPVPPKGGKVSGSRQRSRVKPGEATDDELASAGRILGKLSERNRVMYEVARETSHVRLIVARLRDLGRRGRSLAQAEQQLRWVIAYCAIKLEWQDKPKMENYLRPETLFGPETIERYLAPAIAWVDEEVRPDPKAADRKPPARAATAHQEEPLHDEDDLDMAGEA